MAATKFAAIGLVFLPFVSASFSPLCGILGWSGSNCPSGTTCERVNKLYSQCVPITGLHAIAKSKGKLYFGTATDNRKLLDAPYVKIVLNPAEFGQITPENALKWESTETARGVFNFTQADEVVNFAKKNGQVLRGHTCVWHSQLPSWVSEGGFNASTLANIIVDHCSTVVGRYRGSIYSWDVINEAFNEDGTFRESVFYKTLGTTYFGIALRAARAADPNTKLYINDYNIDGLGAKSTGMVSLVKKLKAEKIPIDGVGLQGHLVVGEIPTYSSIKANLEQFTALGVEVAFTELDIRMTLPVTAEKLEQQRKDYETVIKACKDVPRCVGVTIWDYTDKYSWVPDVFEGEGAPLPWDENLQKKPAYCGIVTGFGAQRGNLCK